jgi:hypothetical protein
MKKLSLLLIVMMSFVRIGFGQEANPNVKPGQGKGGSCECGEKGVNISTGFDNGSNTAFQVGQAENQWKITSGPGGAQSPTAVNMPAWDANNANSTWIMPKGRELGDYVYEYTFNVPAGSTGTLKLRRIGADDAVIANLDGNQFFTAGNVAAWYKNTTLKPCKVFDKLSVGTHKLQFTVTNRSDITGLLVEGCLELVPAVPECRCPAGWLSNTSNEEGGITKDGLCKKMICGPINIKPYPANGTQVSGNIGFFWDGNLYWYGTKANGGAVVCK